MMTTRKMTTSSARKKRRKSEAKPSTMDGHNIPGVRAHRFSRGIAQKYAGRSDGSGPKPRAAQRFRSGSGREFGSCDRGHGVPEERKDEGDSQLYDGQERAILLCPGEHGRGLRSLGGEGR